MRRGASLSAIADFNQSVILDLIRRAPDGVSRVEIAAATGLTPQTISNVSRRLLDYGLIVEAGKQIQGPGKPRVMLKLNSRSRFAVGVHLDPAIITYVVSDLSGAIVAQEQVRTPAAGRPDEVIDMMVGSINAIIDASGVDRHHILGIGIATPGPIDADRGVVVDPPELKGWKDVPLRDALAAATGMSVLIEKDVNAAAVAELWLTDKRNSSFAFFYLGTGIGIGLAVEGEVLRGSSGNAGEGGSLMLPTLGLPASRPSEKLGHLAAPPYLVSQAVEAGLLPFESHISAARVEEALGRLLELATTDERAGAILDRGAGFIGSALVSVINLLDIDQVVFGGPYWDAVASRFLPIIGSVVDSSPDRGTRHHIPVSSSTIGQGVAAVGAACLVLDVSLSPRPSTMLISAE